MSDPNTDPEIADAALTRDGRVSYLHIPAVARITANGGEIVDAPYPEGTLRVGTFRDCEGNVMGLWHETFA